jgi:hypothetical protein
VSSLKRQVMKLRAKSATAVHDGFVQSWQLGDGRLPDRN